MGDKTAALERSRLFGNTAVRMALATPSQVERAVSAQREELLCGRPRRLGEILVEQGVLTVEEADRVQAAQRRVVVSCPECGTVYNLEAHRASAVFRCRRCSALMAAEEEDDKNVLPPPRTEPQGPNRRSVHEIGGCYVQELLGRGAMGSVYRARQISLDRPVALKVLPKHAVDDEKLRARFRREAKAVARLNHPNVVQIYDMGHDPEADVFHITMELVQGSSLGQTVRHKGPLSETEALDAVEQAALGLSAAHQQNLVHRDIKPDNLLRTRDGKVKVADFGLAFMSGRRRITRSSDALGTPAYMAPEQGTGRTVDARTDIYALGASLYALLTGQTPFSASNPVNMMVEHVQTPPPRVRDVAPHVSRATQDLILRCMAKKPSERFPNAVALARAARRARIQIQKSPHPAPETMPPAQPAMPTPEEDSVVTAVVASSTSASRLEARKAARRRKATRRRAKNQKPPIPLWAYGVAAALIPVIILAMAVLNVS